MLSGNSLRQTVHTIVPLVHHAAKLVAVLLRVAGVIAGLVESNGSLPPGLWLTSLAGWLTRTGISSGTLCSVIKYCNISDLQILVALIRLIYRGIEPALQLACVPRHASKLVCWSLLVGIGSSKQRCSLEVESNIFSFDLAIKIATLTLTLT